MKITLLEYLTNKGYEKPESYIRSGKVFVNSNPVIIPSTIVKDEDKIVIKDKKEWVSRGAYKLLDAIKEFDLDLKDKVVLDIGSSTGGFTQVALANGATKVYALDVGTNQLDFSLRRDNKVVVFEKTNLKSITKDMFEENIDVIVTDVSFISLKHVFKVSEALGNDDLKIMALIKPQFEANSDQVQEGGFVPEDLHESIINKVKGYANEHNFNILKVSKSTIKGNKSKNQEYITYIERTNHE